MVATSTYGRILKIDSTKKITKKLAGSIKGTASWMTNIANEQGQVLNSVLTTGEGPALDALCQGIVARYKTANDPAPEDQDYALLREAKKGELQKKHHGMPPTDQQVTAAISPSELARHCRRRTRDVVDMKHHIDKLLEELWDRTYSVGLRLINAESMKRVWSVQEAHLQCIQDPPGFDLYTVTGTLEKGGKILKVLKCARGSSSLESFHRHHCAFVPGWNANAAHMQMYMLEGGINRAKDAVDIAPASQTRMYDIRLMSAINSLIQKVLSVNLLPEFVPLGKPTDELIGVDYLLAQSGKGDFRPSQKTITEDQDGGQVLPEVDVEEASEEDFYEDYTISSIEDIENQMFGE